MANAKEIIGQSNYIVQEPKTMKGHWAEVFKNDNPIYIEIGMGKGKFITESAKKFPNVNFIGIEKYDTIIAKAVKKLEEYDLPNLRLIRMDANEINEIFDKEIGCIYLNFSDPWPKDRHEKRRLTSDNFLDKFEHVFSGHKEIRLKTDNENLFLYSNKTLKEHGYQVQTNLDKEIMNDSIITEYEERFLKESHFIYKLEAYKE